MVIQRYLPHVGGAERQIQNLAPLLRSRGIEVLVLTRREKALPAYEIIDGTPVFRLPAPGPKLVAAICFTISAVRLLRQLDVDLIHAHELLSPTSVAALGKLLYGPPIVAKVLRGGKFGDVHKIKRRSFGGLRIRLLRRMVDVFIAISSEIQRELTDLGIPAERCVFIPNGVDVLRFRPALLEEKRRLRQIHQLPPEAPIAIYVGRLVREKRVEHLISAWRTVRAAVPDALLLIVGSGSEESTLMNMAGPGVRLIGEVSDVAPYFQCSDLFVLPSSSEGLSGALLEALASGLPVVATSVGGATDVIQHLENGYLIPPDDIAALEFALRTLLCDSALRARLGSSGRHRSASAFSFDLVADRLVDTYRGMLASSELKG
jgi:glycosyltransferase involved in cell wall biosynthesis